MKSKILYVLAIVVVLTSACEDNKVYRDEEKVNSWIYSVMSEYYLWADLMPAKENTDMTLSPRNYFRNYLMSRSKEDPNIHDKFSYILYYGSGVSEIEVLSAKEYAANGSTAHSYGFTALCGSAMGMYYCQVLYVIPGSPADKNGIKRGDCFNSINDRGIPSVTELNKLLTNEQVEISFYYPENKKVTMQKGRYEDTPILLDTIYDLSPKTAYLVYNHFTEGGSSKYTNQLREIFREFKGAGVQNLVLDLRYNSGGEVLAAQELASLLVPVNDLNEVFFYKEKNNCYGDPANFEPVNFYSNSKVLAANPNLKNIYILTSKTTASASELIIHCMRPYFKNAGGEFMLVGEKTVGKNVGGVTITNKHYEWEVHPITIRTYDKDRVSGYHTGIDPDIEMSEVFDIYNFNNKPYTPIGKLGDVESESMLRTVMEKIYGVGGWYPKGYKYDRTRVYMETENYGEKINAGACKFETNIPHRGMIEAVYVVDDL